LPKISVMSLWMRMVSLCRVANSDKPSLGKLLARVIPT
jgi:hypothetical protein